jgi:hypothetical protein
MFLRIIWCFLSVFSIHSNILFTFGGSFLSLISFIYIFITLYCYLLMIFYICSEDYKYTSKRIVGTFSCFTLPTFVGTLFSHIIVTTFVGILFSHILFTFVKFSFYIKEIVNGPISCQLCQNYQKTIMSRYVYLLVAH